MTDLAIHTQGLGKRFGERAALEHIDLEVPRGCALRLSGLGLRDRVQAVILACESGLVTVRDR